MSDRAAEYRAAQYKAARRAVARELHPDRGGDPDRYMAALAEVERRFAGVRATPTSRTVVGSPPTAFRAHAFGLSAFRTSPLRSVPQNLARLRKRFTRRNYFEL